MSKETPLQTAIRVLEGECDYHGTPSVSAINRVLNILEHMKDPDAPAFTVGTPEFESYVQQKVNSEKDISNIAQRYDVTEDYIVSLLS